MKYSYDIYGLNVDSSLKLHAWAEGSKTNQVNATIDIGTINQEDYLNNEKIYVKPFSHISTQHYFLDVRGIAKYLVEKDKIIVEPYPNAAESDVVLFLEETPIPVLLQMNDIFLFEAAAVSTPKGVVLFCGKTGVGKSSLIAVLINEKVKLISDDKTLLIKDEMTNTYTTKAYMPRMQLWALPTSQLKRSSIASQRKIREGIKKIEYDLKEGFYENEHKTIFKIILISIENDAVEPIIKDVKGMAKINALKAYTHLYHLTAHLGKTKEHFNFITSVANSCNVHLFKRSTLTKLKETAKTIKNANIFTNN